ncbi:MAG TPA: tRNA (adenosine(37)-N6)-threonylcarbamoyltransferase complex transferase subunit TsaD [Bryobacteraceae bacterium]
MAALILGIESSCDETAAAIVEDATIVRSSVVASQLDTHLKYGGVVPELASREHLRAIVPVVRESLAAAHIHPKELSAVAVAEGPGLTGSLLVGITYAKTLSMVHHLPLIGVNHLEGHIHAVLLETRLANIEVEFPLLALVVSGGHTHLFEMRADRDYRLAGRTRDDAAGEAYDKVAKLLGFPYPGGPVLDKLAPFGNPRAVRFTSPKMKGNTLDFSFSGLKTAVLRWVESQDLSSEIATRRAIAKTKPDTSVEDWLALTPQPTRDLIASFQRTVIEELLTRAARSAGEINAKAIIVSGGVASNAGLRKAVAERNWKIPVYFPRPSLSTDNAAMIAAAAFPKLRQHDFADYTLRATAHLLPGSG